MSGTRVPSGPGPQYDQKWLYWFWDWVRANRAGNITTIILGTTTYTGGSGGTASIPSPTQTWQRNRYTLNSGETLAIATNSEVVFGPTFIHTSGGTLSIANGGRMVIL